MDVAAHTRTCNRSRISATAWVAAAVSAGLAGLAIADQVALGWTRRDVQAHYGPFGLDPAPGVLTSFLAVAAVAAALTFVGIAVLARRGRRALMIVTVGLALVLGVGLGALTTFAFEYDAHVFTSFWRFVPWVLPVAGAVCALTAARSR